MSEHRSTAPEPSLGRALERRDVLLCVGPGGVGKTTCAAAIALAAARSGRRVIVVTVDPSRRLGQALGLDGGSTGVGGHITEVKHDGVQLSALLLDSATVFDEIVKRCAANEAAAAATMANPFYRAARERLGGALEYAAMAQLQLLHADGHYDLVVLDTPPTANALYLLDAPTRLRGLVDNPAAKLLASGSGVGQRLMGLGAGVVLKTLRAITGSAFLSDLGNFLRDFAAVLLEFQRRGGEFEALLTSPRTGVALVTSTTEFAQREAVAFLSTLRERGLNIDGVVLNRAEPRVGEVPGHDALAQWLVASGLANDGEASDAAGAMLEVVAEAQRASALAEAARQRISAGHARVPIRVLERDEPPPEGLAQLEAIGAAILGG